METRYRSSESRNQSDWDDYGPMAMYGGVYVTLLLLTPKEHDWPGKHLDVREPMIRLVFAHRRDLQATVSYELLAGCRLCHSSSGP